MGLVKRMNGKPPSIRKPRKRARIVQEQVGEPGARDVADAAESVAPAEEGFHVDDGGSLHHAPMNGGLRPQRQGAFSRTTSLGRMWSIDPMSGKILRDRIRERLKALGMTPRKASLKAKLGATFLRDLFDRPDASPRYESLQRLAAALDTSTDWLIGATDERPLAEAGGLSGRREVGELNVRHKVEAGSWLEQDRRDLSLGTIGVVPDPAYEGIEQWAELVVGDSMNQEYPAGGWIHVASVIDLGYAPRHSDHVVVVRSRNGGHLVERSVKALERQPNGEWLLVPKSTNDTHKPLRYGGGDETETVEIVGLVLGYYKRRERP